MAVYNSLLQSNRLEECVQLLECIYAGSGIQHLRKLVHRDFLRACQRSKDVRSAFRFVTVVEEMAHIGAFTMLVAVCAEARDVNGALSVLEWVQRRGITPDCKLYTAVIAACAKASSPNRAFRVYQEMLARGVAPTLVTYSALIDAFSRARKVDRVFKLYNEAVLKGIKPDAVLYNILITAAVREGLVARALKIRELMLADGLVPNAVTYGALVHGCSQPGPEQDAVQALALYEQMRRDGIQPTVAVYTAAVDACSVTGDLDTATRIYGHLKQARTRPDETFFSALIKVAGSARQLEAACSLLASMEAEHRLRPTAVTYGALIGVCEKMGEHERALAVIEQMRAADVLPSAAIYNILIHMLGKGKQLGKAVAILDDMSAIGVAPTDVTYGTLLGACARAGNVAMAFQLYARMKAEGIAINLVICNTLIGICLAAIRSGAPPPMMPGEAYYSTGASSYGSGAPGKFGAASFKQPPVASTQDQWASRAVSLYSDALVAGVELPMATVSAVLACLALRPGGSPAALATAPYGSGGLNGAATAGGMFGVGALYGSSSGAVGNVFGGHASAPEADLSRAVDVSVDGCNIYRPRALDIYEEAMARNTLPSFTLDRNSVVDLTNVPPPAAEVCVLAYLRAGQQMSKRRAMGSILATKVNVSVTFQLPEGPWGGASKKKGEVENEEGEGGAAGGAGSMQAGEGRRVATAGLTGDPAQAQGAATETDASTDEVAEGESPKSKSKAVRYKGHEYDAQLHSGMSRTAKAVRRLLGRLHISYTATESVVKISGAALATWIKQGGRKPAAAANPWEVPSKPGYLGNTIAMQQQAMRWGDAEVVPGRDDRRGKREGKGSGGYNKEFWMF